MSRLSLALPETLTALAVAGLFSVGCSAASVTTAVTGDTTGVPISEGPTGSAAATTGGSSGAGTTATSGGTGATGAASGGSTGGTSGVSCPAGGPACGGTCCPGGFTCVNGACCETACNTQSPGHPASLVCCPAGQECILLGDHVTTECAQTCAESSRCPAAAPCCTPVTGGAAACVPGDPNSNTCICVNSSQCSSGCCAPAIDVNGQPVGPYVCKPNDGADYDCCGGTFNTCTGAGCCVKDGLDNLFCAVQCTVGDTTCGPARCQNYDFSLVDTTCGGPTACGPR